MSYADAAASGPSQTAEQMPEVEVSDAPSEHSTLIDVDSPHISSVPSDYTSQSIRTDTQAERILREQSDADLLSSDTPKSSKKAKAKAKSAADKVAKNSDNPVFLGNVVVVGVAGVAVGVSAYRKYQADGFSWGWAGAAVGAVAAFAVADVAVSRWLLQKYPPKN